MGRMLSFIMKGVSILVKSVPLVCNTCKENCPRDDIAIAVYIIKTKHSSLISLVQNGKGLVLPTNKVCRLQHYICLGMVTTPYLGMVSCKKKVPLFSRIVFPEDKVSIPDIWIPTGIFMELDSVKNIIPKAILAKILQDLKLSELVENALSNN